MHWVNRSLSGISRREMLWRCANGFGGLALSCLLAEKQGLAAGPSTRPLAPRATHHPPRAESVIFLFMDGGPSQMDTFRPQAQAAEGKRPTHPDGDARHRFPDQPNGAGVSFQLQALWPLRRRGQRALSPLGHLRR